MTEDKENEPSLKTRNLNKEELIGFVQSSIGALCFGLVGTNPLIPGNVMWEAIIVAMGNVISVATKQPDTMSTIKAREQVTQLVVNAIKTHVSSLQVPGGVVPAVGNVIPARFGKKPLDGPDAA